MQINVFRPIYYLGCKTTFTSVIKAAIDEVDPSCGRLVDLFSGTGAVGSALGLTREVTTVDVQEYSRVLCSAVLNPANLSSSAIKSIIDLAVQSEILKTALWCLQPLIKYEHKSITEAINGDTDALIEVLSSRPLAVYNESGFEARPTELCDITSAVINRFKQVGLWQSADTTVSRYFGGVYFSFQQSAMLDALLHFADISDNKTSLDTLKAAILSTASQIVNTVGKQFAQPIQPINKSGTVKPNLVKIVQRDRSLDVIEAYKIWLSKYSNLPRGIGKPKAIRQDYLEALLQNTSSFSVVYADPPYTRDHYSRFYHVLETMCLRDNPTISSVVKNGERVLSRGAYRMDRHQSPFCIRSTAFAAFESLFKTVREQDLPLVLSYSPHNIGDGTHPRVVSIDQIVEIAHVYYNRAELSIVEGITHNQLNRSGLKLKTRDHAEILLKCFC